MAAPSDVRWGSFSNLGSNGIQLGIKPIVTDISDTVANVAIEVWLYTRYSVNDNNNSIYFDNDATSASTLVASNCVINTTSNSTGNDVNYVMIYSTSFNISKGTSARTINVAAAITQIMDLMSGGPISASHYTSYTIPAQTPPPTITVEYVGNGGVKLPNGETTYTTTATYGQEYTIEPLALFSRSGYECVGWTTNSDGTDDGYNWTNWAGTWMYTNGQYGISSGKLTLYARWNPLYTLTYDGNGGTCEIYQYDEEGNPISSSTAQSYQEQVAYGSNVYIRDNEEFFYHPEGKGFLSWNTEQDGSGDTWLPGERTWDISSDVTLYAQWTDDVSFTVTFRANGGQFEDGSTEKSQTVKKGDDAVPPTPNPTREGKQFGGWTSNYKDVNSNQVVNAIWGTGVIWIMTNQGWVRFE